MEKMAGKRETLAGKKVVKRREKMAGELVGKTGVINDGQKGGQS